MKPELKKLLDDLLADGQLTEREACLMEVAATLEVSFPLDTAARWTHYAKGDIMEVIHSVN